MVTIVRFRQQPWMRRVATKPSTTPTLSIRSSLSTEMAAFLENGIGDEFSDITLICGNVQKSAHKVYLLTIILSSILYIFLKAILSARSAYFETMFRNWMPEKTTNNTVQMMLGDVCFDN